MIVDCADSFEVIVICMEILRQWSHQTLQPRSISTSKSGDVCKSPFLVIYQFDVWQREMSELLSRFVQCLQYGIADAGNTENAQNYLYLVKILRLCSKT